MNLKGKRILIAKPGLDGHDVGAKVIALALRDAGADVIYTGLRKSPEQIARVAIDEDVDAVGLSILSGSHNELVAETVARLNDLDAGDYECTCATGFSGGGSLVGVEGSNPAILIKTGDVDCTGGAAPFVDTPDYK